MLRIVPNINTVLTNNFLYVRIVFFCILAKNLAVLNSPGFKIQK